MVAEKGCSAVQKIVIEILFEIVIEIVIEFFRMSNAPSEKF